MISFMPAKQAKLSIYKLKITIALCAVILTFGCGSGPAKEAGSPRKLGGQPWGKTAAGEAVELYTLTNAKGTEARITTYGGILVSLKVPDRSGKSEDIVLGFDNLDGYLQQPPPPYFGALIGRYGNRIANGQFALDSVQYKLAKNDGGNHLHGGIRGFDKRIWNANAASGQQLELTYM